MFLLLLVLQSQIESNNDSCNVLLFSRVAWNLLKKQVSSYQTLELYLKTLARFSSKCIIYFYSAKERMQINCFSNPQPVCDFKRCSLRWAVGGAICQVGLQKKMLLDLLKESDSNGERQCIDWIWRQLFMSLAEQKSLVLALFVCYSCSLHFVIICFCQNHNFSNCSPCYC